MIFLIKKRKNGWAFPEFVVRHSHDLVWTAQALAPTLQESVVVIGLSTILRLVEF